MHKAQTSASVVPGPMLRFALLPAMVGQALTFALLPPVLPGIAAYLGVGVAGERAAQLVAVMPFLGLAIGAIVSGVAIRLVGIRQMVLVAAFVMALGGMVGLSSTVAGMLFVGCFLVGLGAAMLTSGLSAATALTFEEEPRGRFVGFQSAAGDFAAAAFGLGSAFLAETLGWRTPFGIYCGYGVLILLLSARAIRFSRDGGGPAHAFSLRAVARAWPVCVVGGLTFLLATTQATQLPFLMAENGLITPGSRALVMASNSIMAVIASLLFGALRHRVGDRWMIAIATASGATGFAFFGSWTQGYPLACLAAGLLGVNLGIGVPLLYAAAMRRVSVDASGQAIGMLNLAIFIGGFISPIVLSPVREAAGLSGQMFVLAGLAAALGAIVCARTRRPGPTCPNIIATMETV